MHIAFATLYDPRDPRRGSGTCYFIGRELERQGHRVDYVGPIDHGRRLPFLSRLARGLARRLGKGYRSFQDVLVARRIGEEVDARLRESDADVLLTNDFSIAGFTSAERPVVLYTSMAFPRHADEMKHPWLSGLFAPNVLSCRYVNRRGLERAARWCFPSDWGIRLALDYEIPGGADRARRIEFGDNLFDPPPASVARERSFAGIEERGGLCLLFVGNRDWDLKGGGVAVETVRELRRRGIEAEIDLVGSQPPEPPAEGWIRSHGVIDKVEEPERLAALYCRCDLLLVPTRAEGFGIVFVEAAGHGMPSLSFDSGTGVNQAVRHGESGLLLDLSSPPWAFADVIEGFYEDPASYDRLVRGARAFYENIANWPRAVERLVRAMEEAVEEARRTRIED